MTGTVDLLAGIRNYIAVHALLTPGENYLTNIDLTVTY